MDLNWCKQSDEGLPQPDVVFLLTLSPEAMANRPGYGGERYEQPLIQKRVADMFEKLKGDSWIIVDADDTVDNVHKILLDDTLKAIEKAKLTPLKRLWSGTHTN